MDLPQVWHYLRALVCFPRLGERAITWRSGRRWHAIVSVGGRSVHNRMGALAPRALHENVDSSMPRSWRKSRFGVRMSSPAAWCGSRWWSLWYYRTGLGDHAPLESKFTLRGRPQAFQTRSNEGWTISSTGNCSESTTTSGRIRCGLSIPWSSAGTIAPNSKRPIRKPSTLSRLSPTTCGYSMPRALAAAM